MRHALHPARRAAVGRDRARARLRERPHRRGARGEDLLLAGHRPVRVPGRRQPRRARRSWASASSSPSSTSRVNFIVDVLYGVIDPRIRVAMSTTVASAGRARRRRGRTIGAAVAAAARGRRRRDRGRLAARRDLRAAARAARPARAELRRRSQRRPRAHLFGTDELGRDVSQPRHLRLAHLGAARAAARRARRRDRRRCSARIAGYFRGFVDGVSMRARRPRLRVPGDHPRDGRHRRARPRPARTPCSRSSIVAWPAYARVVRGLVLSVGDSEYV